MLVSKPFWFSMTSIEFFAHVMEVSRNQNCLVTTFFHRREKVIQVWNVMRVSKWWRSVHFWVDYPFKCFKSHSASLFPHFLFLSLLRGNKKKGIKSSIGRLFGKKEKSRLDQPLSKDGQMTPPVIPGSMKQTRIHYMREMSCFYYYYRVSLKKP